MTIYDDSKHPRGQADNAGQYRDKANSEPEARLTTTIAAMRAEFPQRFEDDYLAGDNAARDAFVADAGSLFGQTVTANRIVEDAFGEHFKNIIPWEITADDARAVARIAIDRAVQDVKPAPRFDVGQVLEDAQVVTDVAWQPEHGRYWVTTERDGRSFSGGPEALLGSARTPDAIVEPLVEGASFEALAGTNGYHYLNSLLVTAANHAQLAQATAVIDDIIQDEGNHGDATAEEYAEYAMRHGLLPHTVHKWAHLIESATPTQ